jgi:hypothetical protein
LITEIQFFNRSNKYILFFLASGAQNSIFLPSPVAP